MAAVTFVRKLTFQADTRDLEKGTKTADTFKRSLGEMTGQANAMAASVEAAGTSVVDMTRRTQAAAAAQASLVAQLKATQTEAQRFGASVRDVSASEMRAAESLKLRWDEAYRNATKYAQVETSVAKAIGSRLVTVEQGNTILASAGARFKQMGDDAGAANDNIRLTTGQMQGLGYQINDIATMVAMGASPFQVIASQAGQVVQVLGDGPKGMRGSLAAIGSSIAGFARSIPTAGYVVAGLSAAVGALWYVTRGPQARSAEESVASFEKAVRSLEQAWDGAGAAAERHYERAKRDANANPAAAALDTQSEVRKLQQDYKNAVRDLNFADGLPEQILRARSGSMSEAHREIRELYGELRRGEITAREFSDEMLRIKLDPNADAYARDFAEAIRQGVKPAEDLEARIRGINAAAAELGGKGGRVTSDPNGTNPFDLRDRFGGVTGAAGRFDPEGMGAVRDRLRSQRGELQGILDATAAAQQALANFDLSPVRRQLAETMQDYDRQIAAYKQSTDDTIGLAALQAEKEAALGLITKEATRTEEARRAGHALDLRSITDRTAAQRAATAGERAYIDAVGQGYSEVEAGARSAEAANLSLAQARQQLTESMRQQRESHAQTIAQAELELQLVGATEGASAATAFECADLETAKKEARP